jgi:hypothetical protein
MFKTAPATNDAWSDNSRWIPAAISSGRPSARLGCVAVMASLSYWPSVMGFAMMSLLIAPGALVIVSKVPNWTLHLWILLPPDRACCRGGRR